MQLFITTRGSYLHVHEEIFEIKTPEGKKQFSPKKIESIVIMTDAAISTDALQMALYHNIDIVVFDNIGNPMGRFWHSRYGSIATIRQAQIAARYTPLAKELMREWVCDKINNQAELLRKYGRSRKGDIAESLFEGAKELVKIKKKVMEIDGEVSYIRSHLMGLEGIAARLYFELLSSALPERWRFHGRSRQPAVDEFNAFLNYAYGVLYSLCEKACVLSGLDPYAGFLHVDNYNKPALVFDIIENRRRWADEVVFSLFSGRKVKEEHTIKVPGGLSLDKPGKILLMQNLNDFLDKKVNAGGRRIGQRHTILLDCHRLARRFMGVKDAPVPEVMEI